MGFFAKAKPLPPLYDSGFVFKKDYPNYTQRRKDLAL